MGAPKKLSSYRLFYWNIAKQVKDQQGEAELRFATGDGRSAAPLRAMLTGFRAALEASDKYMHQELGAALRFYSVTAEGSELVLKLKGLGAAEGSLDGMRRAELLSLKSGGMETRDVASYKPSPALERLFKQHTEVNTEGEEAMKRLGFGSLLRRGESEAEAEDQGVPGSGEYP
jgi:hypothetical protein